MKKLFSYILFAVSFIYTPLFGQWIDISTHMGNNYSSVEFSDSLIGWIGRSSYNHMLKTTDGGNTWQEDENSPKDVGRLFFFNSKYGYGVRAQFIFTTSSWGDHWSTRILPDYPSLNTIHFPTQHIGYTCGWGGRIFKSIDSGVNWNELSIIDGEHDLKDIFFINEKVGWIAAWGFYRDPKEALVLKTIDGGETWNEQFSITHEYFSSIYFIDSTTGFVGGWDLYKTTDGGNTWEKVLLDKDVREIEFLNETEGICIGRTEIFKTVDKGETWVSEFSTLDTDKPYLLSSLSYVNSKNKSAIVIGQNGLILKYFGKEPFAKINYPNGGEIFGNNADISVRLFVNNIEKYNLYYSINNGNSWEIIEENIDGIRDIYQWNVSDINSSECLIKITSFDGTIIDVSDSSFIIDNNYNSNIKLFEPVGSEEIFSGNYRVIRWESENVKNMNIEFSIDNGQNWSLVAEKISAEVGIYIWKIPNVESDECKIKITDYGQPNISASNFNPFRITDKNSPLFIWENIFNENDNSYYAVNSIVQKSNGNYALLHYFYDNSSSGSFINEYSSDGELIQRKKLDKYYKTIIESSNGEFFLSGVVPGTNETEPSYTDISLAKLNSEYDTLWTTSFSFQGGDSPNSITEVRDGIIICGYAETSYGEYARPVIIKTDKNGNELWKKTFDINGNYGAWSYTSTCIEKDNGNYLVLGYFGNRGFSESNASYKIIGEAFVAEFDPNGNHQWTKIYTFNPITGFSYWDVRASDIDFTENGFIIVGSAKPYENYDTYGNSKLFFLEIDNSGNELSKKWFNIGTENLVVNNLIYDNNNDFLVSSYSQVSNLYYGSKSFVSHLIRIKSEDGNIKNIRSYNLENKFPQLSINRIFDNGDYMLSGNSDSLIVSKYADESTTPVKEREKEAIKTYHLSQNYPNPFNPTTIIKYTIPQNTHPSIPSREGKERSDRGVLVTLKVYDILGKKVATLVNKEQQVGSYEVEFQANSLSSGVYFYKLQSGSFVETKKMILLR